MMNVSCYCGEDDETGITELRPNLPVDAGSTTYPELLYTRRRRRRYRCVERPEITRRYIGISEREIQDVYRSVNL